MRKRSQRRVVYLSESVFSDSGGNVGYAQRAPDERHCYCLTNPAMPNYAKIGGWVTTT